MKGRETTKEGKYFENKARVSKAEREAEKNTLLLNSTFSPHGGTTISSRYLFKAISPFFPTLYESAEFF